MSDSTSRSSRFRLLMFLGAIALVAALVVAVVVTSGSGFGVPDIADVDVPSSEVTIGGIVRDVETGAGVAGATVQAGGKTTATDDNGEFTLTLDDRRGSIVASAPGYFDAQPVAIDTDARQIHLELLQHARISGTASSGDEPVVGANVLLVYLDRADRKEPGTVSTDTVTSSDGTFDIRLVPGRVRVLIEDQTGRLGESRELKLFGGEARTDIDIDMTPRGALSVTVQDGAGNPVANAMVEVLGAASWQVDHGVTGEQGNVVLEHVPVGETRVRVSSGSYSQTTSEPVDVVSEQTAEITVTMRPLSGVFGVVLAGDKPVRRASVELRRRGVEGSVDTTTSDKRGEFVFEDLEAGEYEVRALHPRYGASETVLAEAVVPPKMPSGDILEVLKRLGEARVEIPLPQGSFIEGIVLGPLGNPIDKPFYVGVHRYDSEGGKEEWRRSSPFFRSTHVTKPPTFRYGPVGPGQYKIYGGTPGYGTQFVTVDVVANRDTTGVEIRLRAGATATGVVTDAEEGGPIAGARVGFSEDGNEGPIPKNTLTDERGRFTIVGLLPGRHSLSVTAPGYARLTLASLKFEDGVTRELSVSLTPLSDERTSQTEFFGIGAVLGMNEKGVEVLDLLEDGPASQTDLTKGMMISAVDGQDVEVLGLRKTIELIRGEEGAPVVLEVLEPGARYPTEITIERGRVRYDNKKK